jgi:hypothetical protein
VKPLSTTGRDLDTPAKRRAAEQQDADRRRFEQLRAAEAFERGELPPAPEDPQPIRGVVGSQRRAGIVSRESSQQGLVSPERMARDLEQLAKRLGWRTP